MGHRGTLRRKQPYTASYPAPLGNSPWWAPRRTLCTGAERVVSAYSTAVSHPARGHAYVSILVHQHQWTLRPERAALPTRFSSNVKSVLSGAYFYYTPRRACRQL